MNGKTWTALGPLELASDGLVSKPVTPAKTTRYRIEATGTSDPAAGTVGTPASKPAGKVASQSAIGRRLRFRPTAPVGTPSEWLTVVGVTSNIVQNDATRQEFESVVYVPYGRRPQPNMFAFVRSRAAIGASATAIRKSVFALDPSLPLPSLAPLEARLSRAHTLERQAAATLGSFSSLALILAAVGMYAVIGQAVTRRTREIGIRLAVGATSRDIVSCVAAGQLRPMAVGVGAGLVLSAGATRFLTTHVAGVQAWDPLVVTLAMTVLAVAAACGYWFPVRRALRVDPAIVLRQE